MKNKLDSKKIFKTEMFIFSLFCVGYLLYTILKYETLLYNEDNFFQLAHGNYLLSHGFPTVEPLRMHEGLHFIVPQWLFAVILSSLHNLFGGKGIVFLYALPLLFINSYMMIYITKKITNKNGLSLLAMSVFLFLQFLLYSYLRPYLFTLFACLLTMISIEKFIETKNKKYLITLPVLSIFEINIHNSLWLSLFLIQACYYGEWIICKIKNEKLPFEFMPMILATSCSCLAGLVNPYGLEYILYILPSMKSIEPFQPYIQELQPLWQNTSFLGIFILFDLFALGYAIRKHISIPYRWLFMFFGFTIMYIESVRNGIFFYSFAQFFFVYILQYTKKNSIPSASIEKFLRCLILVILGICIVVPFQPHKNKKCYDAFDYLETYNNGEIVSDPIFTTFDVGSYGTYKGYRVYIDTCAEIYGIANNKKFDIANEFIDTFPLGNMKKVNSFFDKYNFKYCVVDTESFANVIKATGKYKLIYSEVDSTFSDNPIHTGGWTFVRK